MVVSGRSDDNFGGATADTGSHYLGGIGIRLDRLSSRSAVPVRPTGAFAGPRVRSSRPAWPPGSSRAQPRCWMRTTMTSPFEQLARGREMSSVRAVCASPSAKAAISIPIASTWDACEPSTARQLRLKSRQPDPQSIRSVTFSPASRRARCTNGMDVPGQALGSSSGVVSRSRATIPTSPGQRPLEPGSEGRRRSSNSAGLETYAVDLYRAVGESRPFAPACCGDDVLCAFPEPGTERGGDDVENGLRQSPTVSTSLTCCTFTSSAIRSA